MNKLFLMSNPELFQGEKYLNKNKSYFEGWYFKNTNNYGGISFIPGINLANQEKRAFIQVITDDSSYFINYDIKEFQFNFEPFYIKIGNNYFSKQGINIDIKDDVQKIDIVGKIEYTNSKNINTSILNPNIMGPFSYVPFMECNHGILSMQHSINGSLTINNNIMNFKDSIGYIEKDWGCSFPKTYVWCQGNDFKRTNSSFMLSVADIPFKLFTFKGIICVLIIDNKEYKFATYNNTKLVEYDVNKDFINITLKRGKYALNIKSNYNNGYKLYAPIKGSMSKNIFESISSTINVTLIKNNDIIFSDTSTNCGLEIVL